ncbi:succinoglycan biosynthesis transport protein ExoP [Oxalobacteraceae bacterium GrIS 2.11]
MHLQQILLVIYARKLLVITIFLLTVTAVTTFSFMLPKTYKATASVVMNYKGVDPLTGSAMPGQLLPGYMATQIDIINSKNVALRVVERLKLDQDPETIKEFNKLENKHGTIQDWLAAGISRRLEIVPSRESSVLEISCKASPPEYAAKLANAYAAEYQNASVQLRVEPMQKASDYFNEQSQKLRAAVETAQKKLTDYQQQNGISNIDNKVDVETNRLNELSTQLVGAQGTSMDANSHMHMTEGSDPSESPDIVASPLIQNLKVALGTAESKFANLSETLSPNHPLYISAKAEVEKLKAQIREQTEVTSRSVANNAYIARQREGSVRASMAAQKARVLELNKIRDQMGILTSDLEAAKKALESSYTRFSETKLEGQYGQTDISILSFASVPDEPSFPKIPLNIVASLFLGIMLGVGTALIVELLNRRVRCEEDLVEATQVPVLGVIKWAEVA